MEEENIKKKKQITAVLTIVTVILYIIIFFMVSDGSSDAKKNAKIVTNYSEFYTVSACANRYINFLTSKNSTSLLNVLEEKYKKKNFITEANVLDSLPLIAASSQFASKTMYYEVLKDDIYKYYIFGYLETGELDITTTSRTESYLIVYLDKKNNLYAIEPYDGKEFKEGVFE